MTTDEIAAAIEKHRNDPSADHRYAEWFDLVAGCPEMQAMIMTFVLNSAAHPLVFVFFGMELTRYLTLDVLPDAPLCDGFPALTSETPQ